MTARECLESSVPKEVAAYYAELRRRGFHGERAFQLLRAHKNCSRIANYDDPNYRTFLRNRAGFAVRDLMSQAGMDGPMERYTSCHIFAELKLCHFWLDSEDRWHSSSENEETILTYCERVMVMAAVEEEHGAA